MPPTAVAALHTAPRQRKTVRRNKCDNPRGGYEGRPKSFHCGRVSPPHIPPRDCPLTAMAELRSDCIRMVDERLIRPVNVTGKKEHLRPFILLPELRTLQPRHFRIRAQTRPNLPPEPRAILQPNAAWSFRNRKKPIRVAMTGTRGKNSRGYTHSRLRDKAGKSPVILRNV